MFHIFNNRFLLNLYKLLIPVIEISLTIVKVNLAKWITNKNRKEFTMAVQLINLEALYQKKRRPPRSWQHTFLIPSGFSVNLSLHKSWRLSQIMSCFSADLVCACLSFFCPRFSHSQKLGGIEPEKPEGDLELIPSGVSSHE